MLRVLRVLRLVQLAEVPRLVYLQRFTSHRIIGGLRPVFGENRGSQTIRCLVIFLIIELRMGVLDMKGWHAGGHGGEGRDILGIEQGGDGCFLARILERVHR